MKDGEIKHKKIVQRYYSERAANYDRQKTRTWRTKQGFGDEVVDEVLMALKPVGNRPVLEVCLGTGRTSIPFLGKTQSGLVGLDLSRKMLEVGFAKMAAYRERVDLIVGDADHLPFRDDAFDRAIFTSALHYFPCPSESMSEIYRVLSKKGVLVFGDLTLHELDDKGFLNRLEKTASLAHRGFHRTSGVKRMLEIAGFNVLGIKTFRYKKKIETLVEDKGRYFGVELRALRDFLEAAPEAERNLYSVNSCELTLFYTVIKAAKI